MATTASARTLDEAKLDRINWRESAPFILLHFLPFLAIWTGVTWFDVWLCVGLYAVRMFFITAVYHRYFAHRTYSMNRVMQFLMAFGGSCAVQKGALWWAAHHRHHHKHSDTPHDVHSPLKGLYWCHLGWILCDKHKETQTELIRDFAKFPELRWLDRHYWFAPALLGLGCYLAGGWSCFLIGFCLSTVILWHGTFCVNSAAHLMGRRRYATTDTSRNSLLVALITGGEGWHNNHHHCPNSIRQGFYWYEIDCTYYALRAMSWVGLIRNLRMPAEKQLLANRIEDGHVDLGMFYAQHNMNRFSYEDFKQMASNYFEAQQKALGSFVESTLNEVKNIELLQKSSAAPAPQSTWAETAAEYRDKIQRFTFSMKGQSQRFREHVSEAAQHVRTWTADHSPANAEQMAHALEETREAIRGAADKLNQTLEQAIHELHLALARLEGMAPANA
ncbi:MAG: fatty acid desaturase [Planctomycetota bacterium]|nr:fatty acid desaturase [Planctomycetota bacterium]